VREALEAALGPVDELRQLPGGASKEAWAVRAGGRPLIVRRAGVGVIHQGTLTLEREFHVLEAMHAAGVRVPEPVGYLGLVEGREAFAMERVEGETIGRRIVRGEHPGLPVELGHELARIHDVPPLPFLEEGDVLERFLVELDTVGEPHPAIEFGLLWLRGRLADSGERVFLHGDWRVGNLVVGPDGLVSVLDWEFAHVGDPLDDLAWPLVRAWRFGRDELRLGGIGEVEPYLEAYAAASGREVDIEDLYAWEVLGNVKWATGCLTQSRRHLRGQDRSVEYAVLGRMTAEIEYELLDLIERAT
jgi:aminoglycoside phosphotransferase (APT) family kinase protein